MFKDHCVEGSQLFAIALSIDEVVDGFAGGQCPDDHVCIVIWSGTDFSWNPVETLDVPAREKTNLADKVAVLAQGQLMAFDTPAKVRENPQVQSAYLGVQVEGRSSHA